MRRNIIRTCINEYVSSKLTDGNGIPDRGTGVKGKGKVEGSGHDCYLRGLHPVRRCRLSRGQRAGGGEGGGWR